MPDQGQASDEGQDGPNSGGKFSPPLETQLHSISGQLEKKVKDPLASIIANDLPRIASSAEKRPATSGGLTADSEMKDQLTELRLKIVQARTETESIQTSLLQITESQTQRSGWAKADAERRLAEENVRQAAAATKRTVIGQSTDILGQWGTDSFATALATTAVSILGGGAAVLAAGEYFRIGWLAMYGTPLFWTVATVLFIWSLKRERANSNARMSLRSRVDSLASSDRQNR
jgi:hypothetical protein